MGQGLARAEAATSAAASCLRRRRRRAIGAIVVCGPSLGCPFDECGAHRVRRRTCLPSAFDMNAGLKFGFGGHRQIVTRFRRTSGSGSAKRALRHCERLGMRTSHRSVQPTPSLLGDRNAVTAIRIDHLDSFRARQQRVQPGTLPAAPKAVASLARREGTRAVTRRRSERTPSSAHRCKR